MLSKHYFGVCSVAQEHRAHTQAQLLHITHRQIQPRNSLCSWSDLSKSEAISTDILFHYHCAEQLINVWDAGCAFRLQVQIYQNGKLSTLALVCTWCPEWPLPMPYVVKMQLPCSCPSLGLKRRDCGSTGAPGGAVQRRSFLRRWVLVEEMSDQGCRLRWLVKPCQKMWGAMWGYVDPEWILLISKARSGSRQCPGYYGLFL